MKKKVYLAILTMCIALTGTACGTQTDRKPAQTQAEADDKDKQEEKTDEKETAKKEEAKKEDKASREPGTRIVSVDKVDKYVTLGQYKGLALDKTVEEITENEIDATIQQELQDSAEEVKSGAVQEGDITVIDYVGTRDGEVFQGGSANGQELTIGSGRFIPGFEDGVIGMKKGETKDINLTFPEEYFEPSMAGAEVVFKVTLQSFRRAPELTDDWAAKNTDYKTAEEYRAGVKEKLQERANQAAKASLSRTAWETVYQNSEIKEYPEKDIDEAIAEFDSVTKIYAQQGGMEVDEFLESQGISKEDYDAQAQQYAELKVKQNLIIQAIMDAEGITLEEQASLDIQDKLIEAYGAKDLADLIDKQGQTAVDAAIGLLRVEQFIVDNANIQEKVSGDGTVGVSGDGGDSTGSAEETEEETEAETKSDVDVE